MQICVRRNNIKMNMHAYIYTGQNSNIADMHAHLHTTKKHEYNLHARLCGNKLNKTKIDMHAH